MNPRTFILSLAVLLTLALGLTAFNLKVAFKDAPTVSGAPLAQCTTPPITAAYVSGGGRAASPTETNVLVTPPVTIQSGNLALLWVTQTNGLGGLPIVRDPNRTWQLAGTSGSQLRKLHMFRSLSPNTTTSAVTIVSPKPTVVTNNPNLLIWQLVQHANVNRSGVNGSGAIGQVVSGGSDDGSPFITSIAMPLGPPQSARSATTVGAMALSQALPFIPGQGYSLLGTAVAVSGFASQEEFRPDFALVAEIKWTDPTHGRALAVELRSP